MTDEARQLISSGGPWEPVAGYSRAVRVGDQVAIAGTVAIEDGEVVAPGDVYAQTVFILDLFGRVLEEAGSSLDHVVRTRVFVTDLELWEEFGRAHGEVFGEIRPACTLVEVSGLMGDGTVIEIEADAIVPG